MEINPEPLSPSRIRNQKLLLKTQDNPREPFQDIQNEVSNFAFETEPTKKRFKFTTNQNSFTSPEAFVRLIFDYL